MLNADTHSKGLSLDSDARRVEQLIDVACRVTCGQDYSSALDDVVAHLHTTDATIFEHKARNATLEEHLASVIGDGATDIRDDAR